MKKLKAFTIAAIVGYAMLPAVASAQAVENYLKMEHSCQWVQKVDSIKVDYVFTADSSGLMRKHKVDVVVRRYEAEECNYIAFYRQKVRNEVWLLNNVPVDVVHFRRKDGWSWWQ